jgi:hypothetical protein
VHVIHASVFRRYNPGLWTAVFLFLPLGVWALWLLQRAGAGPIAFHATGFLFAVAIHAAIVLHARGRSERMGP